MLHGTLTYSRNSFGTVEDMEMNDSSTHSSVLDQELANKDSTNPVHKSSLTVKLRQKKASDESHSQQKNAKAVTCSSITEPIKADYAIEALLSSDDNIEPQIGSIQFNEGYSD